MDFISVINPITVTATEAIDASTFKKTGIAGVMFYDAVILTISDGTNSINVDLAAYQPLRVGDNWNEITSDTTTTMIYGANDNAGLY